METASFVISLAGLFNTALDACKSIKLAHDFDKDYTICAYKLSLARLRLSRWGESVGLSGEIQADQTLPPELGDIKQIEEADQLLRLIIDLIKKFPVLPQGQDNESIDESKNGKLFKQLQRLSDKRENNVRPDEPIWKEAKLGRSIWKKTKWVLYKKEECEALVQEVSDFVTELVELFPASEAPRRKLCQDDGLEILAGNTEEEIEELKTAAKSVDDDLLASLLNAIRETKKAERSYNVTNNGRVGHQVYGDQTIYGGMRFNKTYNY